MTETPTDDSAPQRIEHRGRDKLDAIRREAIIRAGWDGDDELRRDLGSYEQAVWYIGHCARHPDVIHPYASKGPGGRRNDDGWRPEIEAARAALQPAAPATMAEMRISVEAYGRAEFDYGCAVESGRKQTEKMRIVADTRAAFLAAIEALARPRAPGFIDELRAAYDKVASWPENNGSESCVDHPGFMDLIALRNLVPEAIDRLANTSAAASGALDERQPNELHRRGEAAPSDAEVK